MIVSIAPRRVLRIGAANTGQRSGANGCG